MHPLRLRPMLAVSVALAAFSGVLTAAAPVAAACSASTFQIQLSGFVPNDVTPFYYAEEGENEGPEFVVAAVGQVCPPDESGQVDYDTPPSGSHPATSSPLPALGDYERRSGFSTFAANGVRRDEVDVPLHEDTVAEAGTAETFTVQLSNVRGFNATAGSPMSAPFFIVDDEGSHRARFVAGSMTVFENRGAFDPAPLRIPVLRAGPTGGAVTFSVEPPNDASAGEVVPQQGTVRFLADGRLGFVEVQVEDDTLDEPDEVFTISLQGAAAEAPSTFRLTVDDNDLPGGGDEDTIAPVAWFHHPKHQKRYRQGSFGADTMHVYVRENSGRAAIASTQIGLRRKHTNGSCTWWKGGRWRSAGCTNRRWVRVSTHYRDTNTRELFIYTAYPSLRPSVGTRIAKYTAFARSTDLAGNVSPLRVGSNVSTFEVTRR